jgi:hypothetical protein
MFRSSSAAAAAESAAAEAAQKATKAQIAACAAYKDRNVLWPDPDIGVPAPLKQSQQPGAPATTAAAAATASGDSEVERIAHAPSPLLADNVSGLQETRVSGFFYPMNTADVADILARARALGKKIAMRGTAQLY